MNPTFFESPAAFRRWLRRHHRGERELWVGFDKRHTGRPSLTWPESVDEALCFGWIDGVRRKLDDDRYVIRFSPRQPGSAWRRLETLIRDSAAGLRVGLLRRNTDAGGRR